MDSSEFLRFVSSRSSVRTYSEEPVKESSLEFLLRCASTAPSAGNREAWDVIAVTDPMIRQDLSRAALHQPHVARAPLVLVVCANDPRSRERYGERASLYAVQDATIACTYLMLSAHALGLSSCWTGAFDEEVVIQILDLPKGVRPIAMLTIGRGTPSPLRTGRIAPSYHLHHEHW